MAHGFSDTQLTLRTAGSGVTLTLSLHVRVSRKQIAMAGLVPAMSVLLAAEFLKTWMLGRKAGHDVELLHYHSDEAV